MTQQRNACTCTIRSAAAALWLALLPISPAQYVMAQDSEPVQESLEPIEEIVVYGDKSLFFLRKQVFRAEAAFFEIFNELNDDDEFDVECFYGAPTGTRIRRHICRANFVVDAEAEEVIDFRDGPKIPVVPARTVILQKRKEMGEKMLALLAERPELIAALNEINTAKDAFYSEREKRCEGRVIACQK